MDSFIDQRIDDLLRLNWFLKLTKGGLYVDFRNPPQNIKEQKANTLLYSVLNSIFEKNIYISGLHNNIQILSFIFDKKIPNKFVAKIGNNLKVMENLEESYYPIIHISKDGKKAECTFPRLKKDRGSFIKDFDPDIFIALAWNAGVKYGILIDEINKGCSYANQKLDLDNPLLTIAIQKDAQLPKDAILVQVSDKLTVDRRAEKGDDNEEIEDMYRFKNTIFQVKKNDVIYRKISGEDGKAGRDVLGKSITPGPPKDDINLEEYAGEGTRIDIVDGFESVVVDVDGTISFEGKKVIVKRGISLKTVDSTTGNLKVRQTSEKMVIDGDIQDFRKIDAEVKELIIKGKIYGSSIEVFGETKVEVLGGVVKGKIIHKGEGEIKLSGKVVASVIYSKGGNVILDNLENSTLIAKSTIINKFQNGNIIASEVNISNIVNTDKGKSYVMGENIYIENILGGGELGITCIWCEDEKKGFMATFKSKEASDMEKAIEDLRGNLSRMTKGNKAQLIRYYTILKELSDPNTPSDIKAKAFLEKNRLYSKAVQPIERIKDEITDLEEKYAALSKNLKNLDNELKRFKINIVHNTYNGDIFVHHYRHPKTYQNLTELESKLLLEICQTKALPSDHRRDYFNKLYPPKGVGFKWDAFSYLQKLNKE